MTETHLRISQLLGDYQPNPFHEMLSPCFVQCHRILCTFTNFVTTIMVLHFLHCLMFLVFCDVHRRCPLTRPNGLRVDLLHPSRLIHDVSCRCRHLIRAPGKGHCRVRLLGHGGRRPDRRGAVGPAAARHSDTTRRW